MVHNDGFRPLDRQACLWLLGKVPVGRVVYTEQALPAVLPVDFRLGSDCSVLVRTSAGSQLARAADGAVVAFEADAFDMPGRSGWSVVVTGRAELVKEPAEQERLPLTVPVPWLPAAEGVFLRIAPDMVTGRELPGLRAHC
ncbi:pyridoxamine 5'-phosphate oxidase family protein [Streptomyces sp. NPDC051133]|uniref:pyridoxamine 5'-phosphate oxidase family protein n=1 Tax=Streptomyces sp. NPDC051133 TaxID=3155521 RepID=UPI00344497A6